MSTSRRLLVLAAVLLLVPATLPLATASARGCRGQRLAPTETNRDEIRRAVRCLINRERRRRGRGALSAERNLNQAAYDFSHQMVGQDFFAHVGPTGETLTGRILEGTRYLVGIPRSSASGSRFALGENIGWGSGRHATPAAMTRAWMRSRGHRRNILSRRFRHVGVGYALGAPDYAGGRRSVTYTTHFGRRPR